MLNAELLRRNHRMPKVQLAKKAGTSVEMITAMEAGVAVPPDDQLERIAQALNFSPAHCLLRPVYPNHLEEAEEDL